MLAYLLSGVILVYFVVTAAYALLTPAEPTQEDIDRQKHAVVIVLGDLGHSPRMSFHALSIAKCGWRVTLVGYRESKLMQEVEDSDLITISPLPKAERAQGEPWIKYAVRRVLLQHWQLLQTLRNSGKIDTVLVQNPPSIPTLGVARFYTLFLSPGTKFIIDWHNLGYTILATKVRSRLAISLYRAYEKIFGRIAYLQLSVSVRLGMALRSNLGINPKRVMPLYDRPWKSYVVTGPVQASSLRKKLTIQDPVTRKLLVTSTSYTPDEDLGMLLDALELYDKLPEAPKSPLNLVVTGKGPLKSWFLGSVKSRAFKHVAVYTLWLGYEEYHRLLSVADLGISLHSSSSGWDLPMKVVDMYGAGLPVTALKFPALEELVKEDNGLTFSTAAELLDTIIRAFSDKLLYAKIKSGALKEAQNTWFEQWKVKLGPAFGYGMYTGMESSSSSDSE